MLYSQIEGIPTPRSQIIIPIADLIEAGPVRKHYFLNQVREIIHVYDSNLSCDAIAQYIIDSGVTVIKVDERMAIPKDEVDRLKRFIFDGEPGYCYLP